MDPVLKRRRTLALTAGVTVITVSGALIGATLKSGQQISVHEERKKKQGTGELNVEQQIALLETTKVQLAMQRAALENKIAEVKEKANRREELERVRMEKMKKLGSGTAVK
ncbi:hypothetical protein EPUS_09226 [Endocarpon pusillum Z07020]|uniref:Uncharacterized protein n=1 Tax=Endocarpon pusillum (strain Z07020 / HMAS-L-300199) TaxID=1263415 RepID=U1GMC5_ENDPU|nr:uncharacterized protein EPUS_09226 [Endocarpon pusillum Z07020]ERF73056.1 hypothetical protein EPUS_09226 [Endocarpon pusillum Z07020]